MTRYASRDEAITREIIEPLEADSVMDAAAEFDVDAIADEVLTAYQVDTDARGNELLNSAGFELREEFTDATAFWSVVEKHARSK